MAVDIYAADHEMNFLGRVVRVAKSSLRRRHTVTAALWAAATVLAVAAGILAIAAECGLCGFERFTAYLAAVITGAGIVVAVAVTAWAKQPSDFYVARVLENRWPELKNALVTFVEFRSNPSEDPSMRVAVGRRAARILAKIDPPMLLPPFPFRRPVIAALGAVLALGLSVWVNQGAVFAPCPVSVVGEARPGISAGARQGAGPDLVPGKGAGVGAEGMAVVGGDGSRQRIGLSGTRVSEAASPSAGPGAGGQGGAAAHALAAAMQEQSAELERLAAAMGAGGAAPGNGGTSVAAGGAEGPAKPSAAGTEAGAAKGADQQAGTSAPGGAAGKAGAGGENSTKPEAGIGAPAPAGEGTKSPGQEPQSPGRQEPPSPEGGRSPPTASGTSSAKTGAPSGGGAGGEDVPTPPQGAVEPPLQPHPPSEDFPPEVLDSMRQVKRLMDEADRRLREGEVTDAVLGRMGMTIAEFRRFVAEWQRKLKTAAAGPAETAAPHAARSGSAGPKAELVRPTEAAAARPIVGPMPAAPDARGGLVQGPEARVSRRMRGAVDAYFETVSRLAAEKPGAKDSKP